MKRHAPAIIAFLACLTCIALLSSCRTQPALPDFQKAGRLHSLPVYDSNGSPVAQDSVKYDSLLKHLLLLQNTIYSSPRDLNGIPPLLKASFDSASGCFLVVGKGTHNKSLPEASWKQGRKIASSYDAKRWALYCKSWSRGNYSAFGTRISGEITYSKILLERLENDTLYTLVSVPFGSIIEN
jgi:hypothetical protein